MHLNKIELTNFRNYDSFKVDDLDKINIIIGSNGQGKTSILESIYVCSLARSFKNNEEIVMLKKDKDFFKIKISVEEDSKEKKLEYIFTEKGKKTKINSSFKKKISDFISQYKVIIFSPDELKIIKEAPSTRRNFLNISLSQINKSYVRLLNNYNVLIKNKNEYLKKAYINANSDLRYLDLLDEKIAEVGSDIANLRQEFVDKINKYLPKYFNKFNKNDDVKIVYESQFVNKNENDILHLLKKNRASEMEIGFTKTGIHRDDLKFLHNGIDAKDFSSQGLQKLILLSLKLSELEILIRDYYEKPILLLDDLFSELDISNRNKVLSSLDKGIQVFITTTDLKNVKDSLIKKAKVIDLGGNENE